MQWLTLLLALTFTGQLAAEQITQAKSLRIAYRTGLLSNETRWSGDNIGLPFTFTINLLRKNGEVLPYKVQETLSVAREDDRTTATLTAVIIENGEVTHTFEPKSQFIASEGHSRIRFRTTGHTSEGDKIDLIFRYELEL